MEEESKKEMGVFVMERKPRPNQFQSVSNKFRFVAGRSQLISMDSIDSFPFDSFIRPTS